MKLRQIRQLIYGIATFMPGVHAFREKAKGTGGTNTAKYCYSIWLRHLVLANKSGLNSHPKIVAELGPGDSLGIGLAALISGSDKYFAFDVIEHANTERNLKIFDELIELFRERTPIPSDKELAEMKPALDQYNFPINILDEKRLTEALEESRIKKIRDAIKNPQPNNEFIQYKVPWYNASVIEKKSIDMIFSQAVLEHVEDLKNTYKSMYSWLRPTGFISHQVDFRSHGTSHEWNGHWTYSDFLWKLIKGKRAYLINREPYSTHIEILEEEGFQKIFDAKNKLKSNLTIDKLSKRYKTMESDDLTTAGVFFQAIIKR